MDEPKRRAICIFEPPSRPFWIGAISTLEAHGDEEGNLVIDSVTEEVFDPPIRFGGD